MTVVPIPSRLGFVAAARAGFDFVTGPPYSMWLSSQDEGQVEYEGRDSALVVLHDAMSYELDIAVWRPSLDDEARHPFTIIDMIRVTDPAKASAYRRFAATTEDSVRHGVAQLVSELRQYGLSALSGEAEFYEKMSDARNEAARKFGYDLADKTFRRRAEQAWQQRDYQSVINGYHSIKGDLSRVEAERLRYSVGKVGKADFSSGTDE